MLDWRRKRVPIATLPCYSGNMPVDATAPADSLIAVPAAIRSLLRSRWLFPLLEIGVLTLAILIAGGSYLVIVERGVPQQFLTPLLVAGLLVANLVPIMLLLILFARRVAKARASRSLVGGRGRLHVRLVGLFSVIASVPTLLVVIFASLLFQYGVEFWFSDRARTVLESADRVAEAYVSENKARILGDISPMASDIRAALAEARLDDPRFSEFFARQVAYRVLTEAAILAIGDDGGVRLIGGANLDKRPIAQRLPAKLVPSLADGMPRVSAAARDRVEAVMLIDTGARLYLYVSRQVDPEVIAQVARARTALSDYNATVERSRALQLRFNAALILVSLLLLAAVIWIALKLADRMVRPVGELVDAARRVAGGDLGARVSIPKAQDEFGTLANTFNRMTRRLEEQNNALVTANAQLDARRAFTEAVLSGVSAGVVSIDTQREIRLANLSAEAMLALKERGDKEAGLVGRRLAEVAPELDALVDGAPIESVVALASAGDARTLAVTITAVGEGHVLSFDDITQQLADQRRAAWSDVARRIAHEIKNPLTPIQLAAERLQRRWGRALEGDDAATFETLTGTIVRQVGDLRRMVDEFSSFARMPKPVFREESIVDIVRQAIFLHEVAHPQIRFHVEAPDALPLVPCDRRQLGQAFLNIIKNAVEAIEEKSEKSEIDTIELVLGIEGDRLSISVADSGVGLPAERERLTEPYMTTRVHGTGLGLAIVTNILKEHQAGISFSDRPGGGTVVTLMFDLTALRVLMGKAEDRPTEDRAVEKTRNRSR